MIDTFLLKLTRLLIVTGFIGAVLLCEAALLVGYIDRWIMSK